MNAVRVLFRSERRARLWYWMALALLVGVLAGAVMSVAAGGPRTETAYRGFPDAHVSSDYVFENGVAGPAVDLDAIARLRDVARTARLKSLVANARIGSGRTVY